MGASQGETGRMAHDHGTLGDQSDGKTLKLSDHDTNS